MDLLSPVIIRYRKRPVLFLFALFAVVLLLAGCGKDEPHEAAIKPPLFLTPVTVEVSRPGDIKMLTDSDSLVPAMLYSNIRGLNDLPLAEKKMRFISALLPAILVAKHEIEENRLRFERLFTDTPWTAGDSTFYRELATTYRSQDTLSIRSALQTHPNSIVLAQAAVESGWGNSRIFEEANNLFGIWSYRSNEPRIAAAIQRGDQTVYLRKYNDISESIYDYFVTIGRSRPYSKFRKARMTSDSVELLLPHLIYYSERREDYVRQLGSMIRFNGLKRFDNYRLDSSYFVAQTAPIE